MSTKWKYATLPAKTRLDMVKAGNKDVYDSEIARSMDVIASRKNLGLDITDQKKWIDDVGYNYNLYNAKNMGISASRVNTTGYADRLLGESGKKASKKTTPSVHGGKYDAEYLAKKYLEEFRDKVSEAAAKKENLKEWLINNGIAEDSETGKRYLEEFENELDELTEKYAKEYSLKVKAALQ